MLDLLVLQLHGCRTGTDYADSFLESDALQGSISWNGVTDIFIGLPRFLKSQKKKKVESEMLLTEIAK